MAKWVYDDWGNPRMVVEKQAICYNKMKRRFYEVLTRNHKRTIRDITYAPYSVWYKANEEFAKILRSIENVEAWNPSFVDIARPSVHAVIDDYRGTQEEREGKLCRYLYRYASPSRDNAKFLRETAEKANVPSTKSFLTLYNRSITYMRLAFVLRKAGIKNNDILYAAVCKMFDAGMEYLCEDKDSADRLIKTLKVVNKIKGSKWVINNFCFKSARYRWDLVIADSNDDTALLEEACQCKTITGMAKYIEACLRSRRYENKTYQWDTEDKKIEWEGKECKFRLPVDYVDMAVVGQKMGICVGGYAQRTNKSHKIVFMENNDGDYIGCIELNGAHMNQLKGRFNNPIDAQYKNDVDEWIGKNGIMIRTQDYHDIGAGKAIRTYNYAQVDPGMYEGTLSLALKEAIEMKNTDDERGIIRRRPWMDRDIPF